MEVQGLGHELKSDNRFPCFPPDKGNWGREDRASLGAPREHIEQTKPARSLASGASQEEVLSDPVISTP